MSICSKLLYHTVFNTKQLKCVVILMIGCLASLCGVSNGQEKPQFERTKHRTPVLKCLFGKFFVEPGISFKVADVDRQYLVLVDPELSKTLELSEQQKSKVVKFNKQLSALKNELNKYVTDNSELAKLERIDFEDGIKSKIKSLEQEFEKLLTQEQKRRCSAIVNRDNLIVSGLHKYLADCGIGQDPAVKEKLKRFTSTFLSEYRAESRSFYQQTLKRFLKNTPEDPRQFFDDNNVEWLVANAPPLCVQIVQLDLAKGSTDAPKSLIVEAQTPFCFEFEMGLTIKPSKRFPNDLWTDSVIGVLGHHLPGIGFEEFQERQFLSGMYEETTDFGKKVAALNEELREGNIQRDERLKRLIQIYVELDQTRWDYLINTVLLPNQRNATIRLTKLHCASKRGVAATVCSGFLSREFTVTPDTKQTFESIANDQLEKAKALKAEHETRFLNDLQDILARKDYQSFVNALSPDGTEMPFVDLELLLR